MAYQQHLEGITRSLNTEPLVRFRKAFEKGELAPLSLVQKTEDIKDFQKAAAHFSKYDDVLILGTGGSSLGAKTLYAISTQSKPRLHLLDNIDPTTFEVLFKTLDLNKTSVLVISKSGSTVETLMQLVYCLEKFENSDHFMVITEPTDNKLRNIAKAKGWTCLDHPTNVGGR